MSTPSDELTATESLAIIERMIQEAKGNLRRNSFYFLFWGWVIVAANAGMFALTQLGVAHPYAVWLITIPAWLYTMVRVFRNEKAEHTATHFDRISAWLWISFGITIFIVAFFGFKLNYQLQPVILVVCAIPTIVSGVILQFRPLIIGGATFWLSGVTCFLIPMDVQPLAGALGIMAGYLIPGYLLKTREL